MEFPHDEQSYFGIIVKWDYSLVNVQTLVLSIEGSLRFEKNSMLLHDNTCGSSSAITKTQSE